MIFLIPSLLATAGESATVDASIGQTCAENGSYEECGDDGICVSIDVTPEEVGIKYILVVIKSEISM